MLSVSAYPNEFRTYACESYKARSIEELYLLHDKLQNNGCLSREDLVRATSGTKTMKTRVNTGLFINTSRDCECNYMGQKITLRKTFQSPQMIVYPEQLKLPSDVVIISVENAELINVGKRIEYFDNLYSSPVIYCLRPIGKRDYLFNLLNTNPNNRYIHWGDFDWGGIRLYLSEIKKRYGDRVSFWVPDDIQSFIKNEDAIVTYGLLDNQTPVDYEALKCEEGLKRLGNWLYQSRAGIEQEVL